MAQDWHAGRRTKGRGVLNLRITSFAGNSERQSFVRCTSTQLHGIPQHIQRMEIQACPCARNAASYTKGEVISLMSDTPWPILKWSSV
ncbi:hypothetical protein EVAR_46195_1 [Eumeta japonica]|uniref:Uncharacterized protein n=1 Tax=Eumeta variegata TaxID=151549 RepID=A0A4C1WGC6_EUMVA|nr:hypothetical protein EVAR_46195_1 [Eumeta japonica]